MTTTTTTATATARPKINDKAILTAAARQLAPKLVRWLDDGTSETDECFINEVAKAIGREDDGYEISRELDTWDPDAELIEILNCASFAKSRELDKALALWVTANNLAGPAVGTEVRDTRKYEAGMGVVVSNDEFGISLVRFANLGHVEPGQPGTQGSNLPWERLVNLLVDADNKVIEQLPVAQPAIIIGGSDIRENGWYWIEKENLSGAREEWTPALWRNEVKSWSSASFTGAPDSIVNVGQRMHAPDDQPDQLRIPGM